MLPDDLRVRFSSGSLAWAVENGFTEGRKGVPPFIQILTLEMSDVTMQVKEHHLSTGFTGCRKMFR